MSFERKNASFVRTTIKISPLHNAELALLRLRDAGVEILDARTLYMLRQVSFEWPEDILTVVTVYSTDISPTSYLTLAQTIQRADKLGLFPCPSELAVHFLLQNPELDLYRWSSTLVAMDPIKDQYGSSNIFSLSRGDKGQRLSFCDARPKQKFLCGRWLFRQNP